MRRPIRVVNRVLGLVDVHQSAVAQAACLGNIFSVVKIVMSLREQAIGAAKAIAPAGMHIDRPVVFGILPVVDRSMLDLANRRIDLSNGVLVFSLHLVPMPAALAQVSARHAQIAQRVQISRMRTRYLRLCPPGKQSQSAREQREQK